MSLFFLLILMNLFYAGSPAFMKLAGSEVHPFHIVYLRHTLALLAFLPFFLLQPQKRIQLHDFLQITLGSFLAFTFASIFQIIGMQWSHAADGTLIMAMEPIIVIILAYFFLREHLGSKIIGGLALAVLGFIILSSNSFETGNTWNGRWVGNLLFLLATTAEASFPIFLKPLLKKYPPLVIAFYCLLCASLYMLPFQGVTFWKQLPQWSLQTWVSIAYLGLGCSFIACLLWLVSLSKVSASLVAISWFIQPVFGWLFAYFLLKETITPNVLIGGLFILSALTFLTHKPKETPIHPMKVKGPIPPPALGEHPRSPYRPHYIYH